MNDKILQHCIVLHTTLIHVSLRVRARGAGDASIISVFCVRPAL